MNPRSLRASTAFRNSGFLISPGLGSTVSHCCISFGKLSAWSRQRLRLGYRARPIATTHSLIDAITMVGKAVSSVEMRQRVSMFVSPQPHKQFQKGLSLTPEQTPGLYEKL